MKFESADSLNKDFLRIKSSKWRTNLLFLKIGINRIIQTVYILWYNPRILSFLSKVITKVWIRKKPLLRCLEIAVTYSCNAGCQQCSCRLAFDLEKEKNERLNLAEWKSVVDEALEMGAFQFNITGGEPLIRRRDVVDLTEYIHSKGGYVHLCTNGYLLNKGLLKDLKNAGLNSIEMGLDGPDEAIHDGNRLKGSHKKVLEVLRLAKKYHILVILNTVLTNERTMSKEMYAILQMAIQNKVLLQVTPACLTGAFKNREDLLLTEDTKKFFYYLLSLSFRARTDLYSSLNRIRCPAAVEKISIQPYGDVVPCSLIQIKYGNIRQNSLRVIQKEMFKNPYYGQKELYGCLPAMNEQFIRSYLFSGK